MASSRGRADGFEAGLEERFFAAGFLLGRFVGMGVRLRRMSRRAVLQPLVGRNRGGNCDHQILRLLEFVIREEVGVRL